MLFAVLCLASPAFADTPSGTCALLRAEADGEAALLYAPRILLDGAHIPAITDTDDPTARAATGLQARLSVVVSPIDILRGRAVVRTAQAECRQTTAAEELERVLAIGPRYGEPEAARAEIDFLESHLGEIDALVGDATARLASQRATAGELDDLRERRAQLKLRIADRSQDLHVLEELMAASPPPPLDQLVEEYRRATLALDGQRAELRALSAWQLDVRGGLAGSERADWFAAISLGYSFGRPWQAAADQRAQAARTVELARDEREPSVRLQHLQHALRRSVESLVLQLTMIDDELAIVRAERDRVDTLAGGVSDGARQLRARYVIEAIELEARKISVTTLIAMRRQFLGDPR